MFQRTGLTGTFSLCKGVLFKTPLKGALRRAGLSKKKDRSKKWFLTYIRRRFFWTGASAGYTIHSLYIVVRGELAPSVSFWSKQPSVQFFCSARDLFS